MKHMCSGGGCSHPSHYAEGGEVEETGEDSANHELLEMCCDELCQAIHAKDSKGIAEAIKAIVMHCME